MQWKVKIGQEEYTADSIETLESWVRMGRVRPEHYVYHPILERWLYAREVEELKPAFASSVGPAPPYTLPAPAKSKSGCGKAAGVGCLALLILAMIGAMVEQCAKNSPPSTAVPKDPAADAAEAAAGERGRAKRTEDLRALDSKKDFEQIDKLCASLLDKPGFPEELKGKCATAHLAMFASAIKQRDFSQARDQIARAKRAGVDETKLAALGKQVDEAEARYETEQKKKREQALARMRKSTDKVQNYVWYHDPTSPRYLNARGFFVYFGSTPKGRGDNLRWKVQYYADDWLFVEGFTVWVDGHTFEYPNLRFERDNGSGSIWEWHEQAVRPQDLVMLLAVAQSKEAIVRFEGRQYRKDVTITAAQKKALDNVLLAYEAANGRV